MKSNKIYIISSDTPKGFFYKIGITNELEKRLKTIKTGNQYPVKIEYYEDIDKSVDIVQMERWIHSNFSDNRSKGEWFSNISIKQIRKSIYNYLIK